MATITSRTLPRTVMGQSKRQHNDLLSRNGIDRLPKPSSVPRAGDDHSAGWALWVAYLHAGRQPTSLRPGLRRSKKPSLLWGMRADGSASLPSGLAATFEIVSALDRCARNKAWNTAVGPARSYPPLDERGIAPPWRRLRTGMPLAWCRALPTLIAPCWRRPSGGTFSRFFRR